MTDDYDSFERLATGLSDSERQSLLEQLEKSAQKHEETTITPVDISDNLEYASFPEQIKREPLLLKIYIWIKALFSNQNQEKVFNEYRLSKTEKTIAKDFPGIIDIKRKLLLASLYNKLTELESAAQFFKPYVSGIDDDEGSFFVILGSLIMPETDAQIKTEADPYSNPVTSSPHPELRVNLLRNLDAAFDGVSQSGKQRMYEAAQSAEWLRVFVKLPFERILSDFSKDSEDIYVCPYSRLSDELTVLARSLCSSFVVTDELLESIYLFSRRSKNGKILSDDNEAAQFLDKARAALSLVHMFMSSVPLKMLGCIISNDIYWKPQPFSGGEDWFVRYKNTYKKIFDAKWNSWVKDCQIESLKTSLKTNFEIDEFPSLPDRPWAELWGGQAFKYELTAGFLFWFIVKRFPDYELSLKTVISEGDFLIKGNKTSFTDNFNSLIQLSVAFQNLQMKCSPSGETSMILKKLGEDRLRTLNAQTRADQIIRGIESDFEPLLHMFYEAAKNIVQLLDGILGISNDPRFSTLSNLNTLQGKDNKNFQQDLQKARDSLDAALNLTGKLEVLDKQKTRI